MSRSHRKPVSVRPVVTTLEDRLTPAGDPLLDSWLKSSPGEFATTLDARKLGVGATTTWNTPIATGTSGTNTVATLGDVQKVSFSSNFVYVQSPDFTSSVQGPWYFADGTPFDNYPSNQNSIVRIPRNPTPQTGDHTESQLGIVGIGVNGVYIYNNSDGKSFSTKVGAVDGKGEGYWNTEATFNEGPTLDDGGAHQPPSGDQHYHGGPSALRAQLRDNIAYHGATTTFPNDPNVNFTPAPTGVTEAYSEDTDELHHSPILGYAIDGYPIYGPYGYSDGMDQTSAIIRNTSSFRLRNITVRTSLPGFAAKSKFGDTVTLNSAGEFPIPDSKNHGPAVSTTFPLGIFIEDYEYLPNLGTLDEYNGRFTKTPEYPNGTYAYFISYAVDDGHSDHDHAPTPAFPFSLGNQFYGVVTGGAVTSISEAVSTHFDITSPLNGGSVRGVVYRDADSSKTRTATEAGISGVTAYLDANSNGAKDTGEVTAVTGVDGSYELPVTVTGVTRVGVVAPSGLTQTTTTPAVTVSGGNAVFGVVVGLNGTAANTPPVAVNDTTTATTAVAKTISVLANDTDAGNNTLTVMSTTTPTNGTVIINADKTLTYTSNAAFVGSDTFTYTISDGAGGTATATVSVTVSAAANTPPVAVNDSASATTAVARVITVLANDTDADGNTLTVTGATIPANGTVVINANNTVTYTSKAGFVGSDTFNYIVSDGKGETAAASVTVTVAAATTSTTLVGYKQFAVGSDAGTDSVAFYNPDGTVRFNLTPFPGFTGGVRTASADFNRDGIADIVVGTGPGRATRVRILDGVTQTELFAIDPFESTFTGGVYVAAGDVNNDGVAELVITPDQGGGPRVRIFNGANGFAQIADFFGIDDPAFRGGARAAIGDLNGDSRGDLIVSAGFGGGPRIAGYNATSLSTTPQRLFADFFAFESTLRNGAFVSAGDVNGDGFADLIFGGGPGGGPRVFITDGQSIQTDQFVPLANFFVGNTNDRGGIRLVVKDLDNDTRADLIVGSGTGSGSRVTAYLGKNITSTGTPPSEFAFDVLSGFTGGVFVG
jgi:hypothetical protein